MKKINNKGFTLIELLAVITIMGILMLVAIPAVSRTIENARRDTFQDVAKEYINAVRNAMLADNISCYDEATGTISADGKFTAKPDAKAKLYSALIAGTYYFPLCSSSTAAEGCDDTTVSDIVQNTKDLMESGGTSPFGGADLVGYVKLEITLDQNNYTKNNYSIQLADTGKHGFSKEYDEKSISRSAVSLKDGILKVKPTDAAYPCYLN